MPNSLECINNYSANGQWQLLNFNSIRRLPIYLGLRSDLFITIFLTQQNSINSVSVLKWAVSFLLLKSDDYLMFDIQYKANTINFKFKQLVFKFCEGEFDISNRQQFILTNKYYELINLCNNYVVGLLEKKTNSIQPFT